MLLRNLYWRLIKTCKLKKNAIFITISIFITNTLQFAHSWTGQRFNAEFSAFQLAKSESEEIKHFDKAILLGLECKLK